MEWPSSPVTHVSLGVMMKLCWLVEHVHSLVACALPPQGAMPISDKMLHVRDWDC